ncbi:MAG: 4-hydroxy-tetrahydrodipicolinate reductase [Lachnospiraceae bacterium]|nr:4-hydroxy-tetrahydrodipicolinate reductase [Lachnospiraceae bacterium]
MIRVIMHGANGRIGQTITQILAGDDSMQIVAGVDKVDKGTNPYPVFNDISECNISADVIIDFSNSSAVDGLIDYAIAHDTPVVLCTTGLSEEQLSKVGDASGKVAILRSANMSIGVNLLMKLVNEAAGVLGKAGFDTEIVEKHHRHKLDAPSGTALALADSAKEALGDDYEYVYDRTGRRMERPVKEIGISAVRGGSIVGDHDVIFAGTDEVITLSHTAYSRSVFAKGAIEAARFLSGKAPGMYSMSDVIG